MQQIDWMMWLASAMVSKSDNRDWIMQLALANGVHIE